MDYTTFELNSTFKNVNSDYITLPPMVKFCRQHQINRCVAFEDYIHGITNFAHMSNDNFITVLKWGNMVLKQGIKQVYVTPISFQEPLNTILRDYPQCCEYIDSIFLDSPQNYLLDCITTKDLKLQRFEIIPDETETKVNYISFYFSIRLLEGDIGEIGDPFIYPIFVDLDLNNNLLIARAKSKSSIYEYNDLDDTILKANSTDIKSLVTSATRQIYSSLNFSFAEPKAMSAYYKNSIYNFLEELTFTPECIETEIMSYNDNINSFITNFFTDKNIPDTYIEKAREDMEIFVEKYLSISYSDKELFTQQRDGYPIDVSKTDHEKCRMREISPLKLPLQTTELFFDNKKSMRRDRSCDILRICYKRIDKIYYGSSPFLVVLDTDGGFLRLSFRQYVEEEDILNVLYKVIQLGEV